MASTQPDWGSAWSSSAGRLTRIDPATNRVVATVELGYYPNGLAFGPDGVWVAVARTDFPTGG